MRRKVAIGIGVVAFIVLCALVAANLQEILGEPKSNYQTYYGPGYGRSGLSSFFAQTLESIEAFWTAIASLVGIIASVLLYLQIVSGNEAVEQTKRSSQYYIDGERGFLSLHSPYVTKDKDDTELFNFQIENIGRGPVSIFGEKVWAWYYYPLTKIDPVMGLGQFEKLFILLKAGGSIATDILKGAAFTRTPVSIQKYYDGCTEDVLFQGFIHYKTALGTKHTYAFTGYYDRERGTLTYYNGKDEPELYNYDIPYVEPTGKVKITRTSKKKFLWWTWWGSEVAEIDTKDRETKPRWKRTRSHPAFRKRK